MDVGCAPLTMTKIEKMLAKEGLCRGTTAFVNEFDRRYRPSDLGDGTYVERGDWDGNKPVRPIPAKPDSYHIDVV